VDVTFYGVRGSCPCAGEEYRRFGGNTSAVLVEIDGDPPLILDLGTGAHALGRALRRSACGTTPFRGTALLTHLHYDHILGLPFFPPLAEPGTLLEIHGPRQGIEPLAATLRRAVQPPFFPVHLAELHGDVIFHDLGSEDFAVGSAKVRSRPVPHPGATLGYRIEAPGAVLAYVPDHQAAPDRQWVDPAVLELCDGADLVIHDAQYSEDELDRHPDWGHSSVDYAVRVAAASGARRLALFHHDPSHADRDVDALVAHAGALPAADRLDEVYAASEGTTVVVGSG